MQADVNHTIKRKKTTTTEKPPIVLEKIIKLYKASSQKGKESKKIHF